METLLSRFAGQEALPKEVYKIAKYYYGQEDRQDKAIELYQYMATTWPEDDYALSSLQEEAISRIKRYQMVEAQEVIEILLTNFSEHKKLAEAINGIANAYHRVQDDEKALEFYNYVLANYPINDATLEARKGTAIAYIGLNQDEQVDAAVETLMTDYTDHSGLSRAVFIIGEEYYFLACKIAAQGNLETAKENFTKALLIWQKIVDQLPESDHAPHAHYFVAVCYKQLKQFTLAVEYYKIVVDRWPDFTWFVPYRIGVLYRNLKKYDEAIEWFKLQREL
jgi:tetratricopeptide (TPR) repeat protein